MLSEQNEHPGPSRPRVLDLVSENNREQSTRNRKKKKRNRPTNNDRPRSEQPNQQFHMEQWPLESQLIKRSVLEYGRRCAELAVASTLKKVQDALADVNVQSSHETIVNAVELLKQEIETIKRAQTLAQDDD